MKSSGKTGANLSAATWIVQYTKTFELAQQELLFMAYVIQRFFYSIGMQKSTIAFRLGCSLKLL